MLVLEQALLNDPQRHDLREKLARLALDLGKLDQAQEHIDILQKALKDHGEVEHLQGMLAEAKKDLPKASLWYLKAYTHAPQQVESYVRRADVLRQMNTEKTTREADEVMSALLVANAQNASALLAKWQYHRRWLGLEAAANGGAAGDINEALKLAPDDAEVVLAAVEMEQARKNPNVDRARGLLQKGRKAHPQDFRMYRELALLEIRQAGKPGGEPAVGRARALACLHEGCQTVTRNGKSDLLWTLGNVLLDGNNGVVTREELDETRRVIGQMARAGGSPASVDYLNARVYMKEEKWGEAARLLASTREVVKGSQELARQADLFLAECHAQLNDPAAQVASYESADRQGPSSLSIKLGLAGALAAQGRIDEAIKKYNEAKRLPDAPVTCWVETARLLVLREVLRNSAPRAPKRSADAAKAIDAALSDAEHKVEEASLKPEEKVKFTVSLALLRSEVLVDRNEVKDAEAFLVKALQSQPEQVELWAGRAMLTVLPGDNRDPERGKRILADAEKALSAKPEKRLALQGARVRFLATWGGDQAVKELRDLEKEVRNNPPELRSGLFGSLAEAYYRLGKPDDAGRLWDELAALPANQNNLTLRLLLFDLALQGGKDDAMQRRIDDIRRTEGADGVLWRYATASRLVARARSGKSRDGLEEARQHLDVVGGKRPNWPAVDAVRGELEELRGNLTQATVYYKAAVDKGERNPRVASQLVALLRRQQRDVEASQVLSELTRRPRVYGSEGKEFLKVAADDALRGQMSYDEARAIIAQAVNANDFRDLIWQGQVLADNGHDADAETTLRRAIEISKNAPEAWVALVQFLAARDREKAEGAVGEASARMKGDDVPLALARCAEVLGQPVEAAKQYEAARKARPNDPAVLRTVADYYFRRGQVAPGESALRALMDLRGDDAPWARRQLALLLASRAEYRRYPEALALVGLKRGPASIVESEAPKTDDPAEELRTRILVLAAQPLRDSRKKAIALLEEMNGRKALLPDDQFLLARLYENDDNWTRAREMHRLAVGPGKNVLYLATFAQALMRQRPPEWNEANTCITKLEELEKSRHAGLGGFGSVELRAMYLEGTNHGAEAIQLLTKYSEAPKATPDRVLLLVGALARQKKFTEALALCVKARATCPPEQLGGATVALLRASGANRTQCDEVETWLKAAGEQSAAKEPGNTYRRAMLFLHRADLRETQGDLAGAEDFCRKARAQDGANLVTLNNLAWLLAQNGKATEALEVINAAVELGGPRPQLLDTRATVYLALKRGDLAIADIEAANADGPTPTRYFHLAQAHRLSNNTKEAAAQLLKATKSGLKKEHLHPVERAAYEQLVDELKMR
jgi:tetratricopeptide (TPR) repeat protein